MMGMSSYDAWVTREPDWHSGADLPEECLECGKPLAHNNTCGYCYRKECRDVLREEIKAERAYENALYADYIAEEAEERAARECLCHKESGSHELCCGREDGRNPDCPIHGDGSTS